MVTLFLESDVIFIIMCSAMEKQCITISNNFCVVVELDGSVLNERFPFIQYFITHPNMANRADYENIIKAIEQMLDLHTYYRACS